MRTLRISQWCSKLLGSCLAVFLVSHSLLLTPRATEVIIATLATFFDLAFSFFSQALTHAISSRYWVDGVSPTFVSFPEPQLRLHVERCNLLRGGHIGVGCALDPM